MKLLLAEDEKELANALKAVLIHNHYSVDVVYNGEDAYHWAMAANYDGLILDIMMPKKSGIQVLKELRQAGSSVPVLLLSCPELTRGNTYLLTAGEKSQEVTIDSVSVSNVAGGFAGGGKNRNF